MGQRSQIYVRLWNKENPKLYAKYYGWNYAERMISRARYGIEYIKEYRDYISQPTVQEKINRIFDVNFDMKDIAITSDVIKEWIEQFSNIYKANEYIFECVDNNDGKLFVDISKDNKLKYCFTDCNMKILSPKQYMDWDFENWENSEYLDKENVEICKNNIKYIEENAIQMTEEELQEFINFDYSKQINELSNKIKEKNILNSYITKDCEINGSSDVIKRLIDLGADKALLLSMGFDENCINNIEFNENEIEDDFEQEI